MDPAQGVASPPCENGVVALKARVILDTSAVKHSIRSRTVLSPRRHTLTVGERLHQFVVHEIVDIDPTTSVQPGRLLTEIALLSEVARRAKAGDIELLWHTESEIEFFAIHLFPGGGTSDLLDAGITVVEGPVKYGRLLSPLSPLSGETWRTLRTDFLNSIDDPRFVQLQRACGAHQGDRVNENQLADAFHVWCAEATDASHFLTTDFKLARLVRAHKAAPPRVRIVAPSELLDELGPSGT
jgi:hypothetical protein